MITEGNEPTCRTVLLIGTTGSGKTTVLRQLLGTNPVTEKFPATSPNKTTVATTTVRLRRNTPYSARVRFHDEAYVCSLLRDNVRRAVALAVSGRSQAEVARALLDHPQQGFRLTQLIDSRQLSRDDGSSEDYRFLRDCVDALRGVCGPSSPSRMAILRDVEMSFPSLVDSRPSVSARIVESFVGELMTYVRHKIAVVSRGGWSGVRGFPAECSWSGHDRNLFMERLRPFASNEVARFGSLLTPLVSGIDVAGPFYPDWFPFSQWRPLQLVDTQGLGHTAESATQVPLALRRWLRTAEAVVLVDNAKQPVQASAAVVMEEMARAGLTDKVHYAFTHMDQICGDNLDDDAFEQRRHVYASLRQTIASLRPTIGTDAAKALEARCRTHTFYLGNCHAPLDPLLEDHLVTRDELRRLLASLMAPLDLARLGDVDSSHRRQAVRA